MMEKERGVDHSVGGNSELARREQQLSVALAGLHATAPLHPALLPSPISPLSSPGKGMTGGLLTLARHHREDGADEGWWWGVVVGEGASDGHGRVETKSDAVREGDGDEERTGRRKETRRDVMDVGGSPGEARAALERDYRGREGGVARQEAREDPPASHAEQRRCKSEESERRERERKTRREETGSGQDRGIGSSRGRKAGPRDARERARGEGSSGCGLKALAASICFGADKWSGSGDEQDDRARREESRESREWDGYVGGGALQRGRERVVHNDADGEEWRRSRSPKPQQAAQGRERARDDRGSGEKRGRHYVRDGSCSPVFRPTVDRGSRRELPSVAETRRGRVGGGRGGLEDWESERGVSWEEGRERKRSLIDRGVGSSPPWTTLLRCQRARYSGT